MLRRHDSGEAEANITSAVRDFLVMAGLARRDQIVEENPPSDGSRRAVDLTALDSFVEVKRRVSGARSGFAPDPEYVRQLDEYLAASERDGKAARMGVLTDGKYWLLRWNGAGEPNLSAPYAFTLESAERWLPLYEWLRDNALTAIENARPDRDSIERRFGPGSPSYERDIAGLKALYRRYADRPTVRVKRRLWRDLLRTALGEIAPDTEQLDDLFVRHTYLTAVIGMVVQASFGVDIRRLAETDAADLLYGREFRNATGLQGVVESDFFAWPAEMGEFALIRTLARRIARFDWAADDAPADVAAILYETVIPTEEREALGEYYTPPWLARAMVRELVAQPLEQRVLDPACGSGAFIAEAIAHFLDAARDGGVPAGEVFARLRERVIGIDVHPVAVHLARAAYALAAKPAIEAAAGTSVSVPIYLGDSLQLRYRSDDLFAEHEVTIQVEDERNTSLVFPVSLVERADTFDALMGDVAESIENREDAALALDDHGISDTNERAMLETVIETMRQLHDEGRNHIWAYYTRNMVRPVALSRAKVDVVIGNPPWLNYNQTVSALRTALERQNRDLYGIWAGGVYATQQDVAGLFFARSVDLYLKAGGVIGMVLPHSALQAGQYAPWRTGAWTNANRTQAISVDFGYKTAWDLERLSPNNFFPVPASVAFAKHLGPDGKAVELPNEVERWYGATGADDVRRVREAIVGLDLDGGGSPYDDYARNGATIFPRRLFFVDEIESSTVVQAGRGGTATVNPRIGRYDKSPWKDLDYTPITGQTIEATHVYDVHLGETLVPYATLPPLRAVLPVKRTDSALPKDALGGVGGVRLGGLERRMRRRWQTVSDLWERNKPRSARNLDLLGQLDYFGKLSAQLEWRHDAGDRPFRICYSTSGAPTAALISDPDILVENVLYWVACKTIEEAYYLLAIINSDTMYESVKPLMPKGQLGPRHLHKHLWRLPIPEYDGGNPTHRAVSDAGKAAASGAARELERLRSERERLTPTIARRELRAWLRDGDEGRAVEGAVGAILGV